jgi:hypothetical protein
MRKLLLTGLILLFVTAGAYPKHRPTPAAKKPEAPEIEVPSTISAIILLGGTALVIRGRRKKSTI